MLVLSVRNEDRIFIYKKGQESDAAVFQFNFTNGHKHIAVDAGTGPILLSSTLPNVNMSLTTENPDVKVEVTGRQARQIKVGFTVDREYTVLREVLFKQQFPNEYADLTGVL